jgi:hypothetical protein
MTFRSTFDDVVSVASPGSSEGGSVPQLMVMTWSLSLAVPSPPPPQPATMSASTLDATTRAP